MQKSEEQETELTKRLPNIHIVEIFGWFILCIFAAGVMLMVLMFCSVVVTPSLICKYDAQPGAESRNTTEQEDKHQTSSSSLLLSGTNVDISSVLSEKKISNTHSVSKTFSIK